MIEYYRRITRNQEEQRDVTNYFQYVYCFRSELSVKYFNEMYKKMQNY